MITQHYVNEKKSKSSIYTVGGGHHVMF